MTVVGNVFFKRTPYIYEGLKRFSVQHLIYPYWEPMQRNYTQQNCECRVIFVCFELFFYQCMFGKDGTVEISLENCQIKQSIGNWIKPFRSCIQFQVNREIIHLKLLKLQKNNVSPTNGLFRSLPENMAMRLLCFQKTWKENAGQFACQFVALIFTDRCQL